MQKRISSYHFLIVLLFIALIVERLYGIWFLRWAFDEEQNFGGGTAILKYGLNLLGLEVANPEMEHLVSIYGIVGKYLAVIPAALGFVLERVFSIDLPIPLGLIFTRIVVSFLPSILTIYLMWLMVRQMGGGRIIELSVLLLFLFTFKHIETAHYGVSDALSTFFVVLSSYFLLQFYRATERNQQQKFLIWTALACMLAVSTKINVGIVISGVVFGALVVFDFEYGVRKSETEHRGTGTQSFWGKGETERREGEKERKKLRKGEVLTTFVVASILIFVVINLPYLWNFSEWYEELIRHINEYPYTIKGTWKTPFYFHPPFGVGWGILTLGMFGGLVYGVRWTKSSAWKTKNKEQRLEEVVFLPALGFLVLFYIYLALSRGVIHRWTVPMTPFLVFFAAYFCDVVYNQGLKIGGTQIRKGITVAGAFVLIGIGFVPLSHVLYFNLSLTETPNSYVQLQKIIDDKVTYTNCIYNLEGLQIRHCSESAPESIEVLEESGINCIVFSDFWFSERRYPSDILYLEVIDERTHGNWREIRDYLEQKENKWILVHKIEPQYYTHWSTNIAQPPVFYIYQKTSKTAE